MGQFITERRVNATTMASGYMFAQPLTVFWRVKDLNSFNSEYASSLAHDLGVEVPALTTTGSPAPSSTSTSSTTAKGPEITPAQGLTTGAKIGISLGTIFGLLLLAALGFYFFYARKRRAAAVAAAAENTQPDRAEEGEYVPEMEDQDHEHASRKLFAQGRWRSEADAAQKVSELQNASETRAAPVELEARRPVE